jgi:hypothetical protein
MERTVGAGLPPECESFKLTLLRGRQLCAAIH